MTQFTINKVNVELIDEAASIYRYTGSFDDMLVITWRYFGHPSRVPQDLIKIVGDQYSVDLAVGDGAEAPAEVMAAGLAAWVR